MLAKFESSYFLRQILKITENAIDQADSRVYVARLLDGWQSLLRMNLRL